MSQLLFYSSYMIFTSTYWLWIRLLCRSKISTFWIINETSAFPLPTPCSAHKLQEQSGIQLNFHILTKTSVLRELLIFPFGKYLMLKTTIKNVSINTQTLFTQMLGKVELSNSRFCLKLQNSARKSELVWIFRWVISGAKYRLLPRFCKFSLCAVVDHLTNLCITGG